MRLTVKDVSDFLNVSTKTIYRWVTAKGLPSYRFNNQYFFSRAEIIEWATENRIPLHRDVLLEIDKDVKEFPPFLTAMEDGGIYYRIQGSNKNEVLRNIVNNLKLPAEVDRDFIFEMLRAREMLGKMFLLIQFFNHKTPEMRSLFLSSFSFFVVHSSL